MKVLFTTYLFLFLSFSFSQVFNQGYGNTEFKNLLANGITYVKTGHIYFDSIMVQMLEHHWKFTSYAVIERYKEPEKNSTALFITTQKPVREHQQDRKNARIITLMPAKFFDEGADYENVPVDISKTLGYMYFNGFHDLIRSEDEYRYIMMMLNCLQEGLAIIKENQLTDVEVVLNENISKNIYENHKTLVGNTLILHRDQATHFIDMEKVKTSGIKYRLLADEEYHNVLDEANPLHYLLYFGENKYTEMSLIRIATGEMIYTKHFPQEYLKIGKKETKVLFGYFK